MFSQFNYTGVNMRHLALYPLAALATAILCSGVAVRATDGFYGLSAIDTDGKNVSLSSLEGKVTVVVNVATY